jgi:hypothetical protein
MKKFFERNISVLILSLFLLVIFIFGGMYSRYMTAEREEHIETFEQEEIIRKFNESLINLAGKGETVEAFEISAINQEYSIPGSETESYQPELVNAYKILDNSANEVAVVYIISTIGREEGLVVAYAIDIETDELIDVLIIENDETPEYFEDLDEEFYNQFNDKTLDEVVFTIDAVAGSTLSSLGFEVGMKYARELYARDFSFEIPVIIYTINWIERNFDEATMVQKPFIANITYGRDDQVVEAYFDKEFNFIEVISGVEPSQLYQDVIKNEFPNTSFIDLRTHIVDYDNTTRTITIETKAYARDVLSFEVEFNSDFTAVVSIIITTHESYDNDYNEDYTGGNVPAVENAYKDQYLADGTLLDTVSGATVTSNGIIRILNLVDEVMNAWNGGN